MERIWAMIAHRLLIWSNHTSPSLSSVFFFFFFLNDKERGGGAGVREYMYVDRGRAYAYVFCMSRSGRMIPDEKMAPADLAVP